jgi:predicted RNA-binding protein with PUA-like domain
VPIQPQYHEILFPDFQSTANTQEKLFEQDNQAGNAIKMAYLCRAQTKSIKPGDILLFYRSEDERALTSIGVVESYETLHDAVSIVARVKRRTVYTLGEIENMATKPTKVILFRFVRHLPRTLRLDTLLNNHVLNGRPQSITKIEHEKFETIISLCR